MAKNKKEPELRSFESYEDINPYEENRLSKSKPSTFNGNVEVKRYRITIECISTYEEECENLQYLWDHGDNYHHIGPLKDYAEKLNYGLKGNFGSKKE